MVANNVHCTYLQSSIENPTFPVLTFFYAYHNGSERQFALKWLNMEFRLLNLGFP